VQHFSRSLENHREEHPKLTQNDSQKALRDYEKGMEKSTREKGGKHKEKGAQNGASKTSRRPSGKFLGGRWCGGAWWRGLPTWRGVA